nr:MAG TPA: hypothetical protein [Caudoviricetes sp.]
MLLTAFCQLYLFRLCHFSLYNFLIPCYALF